MKKILFEDSPSGVVKFTRLPAERLTEAKGSVSAWEAQLWHLGVVNLNGRVYSEPLAQRMIAENKTTVAYDGHDGDRYGDYGPVKAICKNPHISGEYFCVDVFIIDEAYSKKLEVIAEHELPIGVSSVGYGETDQNGVVNAATYELVRYLDFVTTPAGGNGAKKKEAATKESERNEETQEEGGVPPSENGELSSEVEAQRKLYTQIQNMILGGETNG